MKQHGVLGQARSEWNVAAYARSPALDALIDGQNPLLGAWSVRFHAQIAQTARISRAMLSHTLCFPLMSLCSMASRWSPSSASFSAELVEPKVPVASSELASPTTSSNCPRATRTAPPRQRQAVRRACSLTRREHPARPQSLTASCSTARRHHPHAALVRDARAVLQEEAVLAGQARVRRRTLRADAAVRKERLASSQTDTAEREHSNDRASCAAPRAERADISQATVPAG